jgi:hypothetical protein
MDEATTVLKAIQQLFLSPFLSLLVVVVVVVVVVDVVFERRLSFFSLLLCPCRCRGLCRAAVDDDDDEEEKAAIFVLLMLLVLVQLY